MIGHPNFDVRLWHFATGTNALNLWPVLGGAADIDGHAASADPDAKDPRLSSPEAIA
jgi:hypothetical protein